MRRPLRVYLCDLTHDTIVLVSDTIPINIGFIGAYAKKVYGNDVELKLFKYPKSVFEAVKDDPPDVLALSNYSWNSRLSESAARRAKEFNPRTVTVQGGTNFPHRAADQLEFLGGRPSTDFYVELEAEVAFANLIGRILAARDGGQSIFDRIQPGCVYIHPVSRKDREPVLVKGDSPTRIKNLDEIPSPYLTGVLEPFFDGRLTPFLETNRGCPFECSFCHTGATYFQKINMFSIERVAEEIRYIAPRAAAWGIVNLHIADTNFAMYPRDHAICEMLLESQKKHGWPRQIMATTGKNNKEQVIEITQIMGNTFSVNMSVQSMDEQVLTNIRRSNIRLDDYMKINQSLRAQGRSTKGELIIGLPGETKESFVQGVEQIIDVGVTDLCCYTLMLLHGTEFKDPEYRRAHGIQGKYRIVPLDFGEYDGERVFDVEEVCVTTKDMSFQDYLWIRGLCFVVESLYNSRTFEELFRYALGLGVSRFQMIRRLYQALASARGSASDAGPEEIRGVARDFIEETRSELWDSEQDLIEHYRRDENYGRLVRGVVGGNLIYKYKAVSIAVHHQAWVDFIASMCLQIAHEKTKNAQNYKNRAGEIQILGEYLKNKLAGILNAEGDTSPKVMESPYDIIAWLQRSEGTALADFVLECPVTYVFEYTQDQLEVRVDHFKRYGTNPNALSKIVTRVSNVESLFRKIRVMGAGKGTPDGAAPKPDRTVDRFIRYTLAN